MENKNEISAYLENISILLLGLFLFAFTLVFSTVTTDAFTLPKQVLLIAVGLVLMLLSGARMISEGSVRIRRTPFDIPVALFGIAIFVSSVLAINKFDAVMSVIPTLFAIAIFFFIVNLAKNGSAMTFLLSAFLTGSGITALISVLSYAKVYVFPMAFTKNQNFTTMGTTLDQAMYLLFVLPILAYFVYHLFMHVKATRLGRGSVNALESSVFTSNPIGMGLTIVGILAMVAGVGVAVYQMTQLPSVLLPFDVGFQTALASLSQDAGRVIQGFLFGSGYGTYSVDFTRFHMPSFNLNANLWSLTFFRSSSYVLELVATTGVAGLLSFGYIMFTLFQAVRVANSNKGVMNPLMISIALIAVAAFILPFSPVMVVMFFIILGLYAGQQRLLSSAKSNQYHDVELHFVAFTEGLMPLTATPVGDHASRVEKRYTKILPVTLFILFAIVVAVVGYFTYSFALSDVIFQRSLVAASQNNGLQTYTDQVTAIRTFPYRDAYYRIASQTDLALANSLASSIPAGSSPSAQIQQNVTQLIQESIATGRTATQLAPQTAANWQNLSSIYRGLIGFGQNAEQFAIATQQQAITLNPNDPQGYINLGGIYYQLSLWDNAQQAFQTAVQLKPDYANAYYNLGHALESKGDLENALVAYQTVEQLTKGDKQATEKITGEIAELNKKIMNAADTKQAGNNQQTQPAEGEQPPLEQNQPETQLPAQKNPVEIPGLTPSPSPKASGTPVPSPSKAVTPSPSPTTTP